MAPDGLAIVAGRGDLPRLIAEDCARRGATYRVVVFDGVPLEWTPGHPVVAATITINFRRSLPLHRIYIGEASITSVEGTKVYTQGRIHDPATGTVFSDGTGLFIIQPLERFGEFLPTGPSVQG